MPQIRESFRGELWSVSEQAMSKYGTYWVRHGAEEGFHPDPDTINGGGNSGYQATHLAATFGARKIALLGFDMQWTGGREHWHGKHEGGLANGKGFPNWIPRFAYLARDFKSLGIECYNCSRVTALKCFERRPLAEVLDAWDSESASAQVVPPTLAVGADAGLECVPQVGVPGPAAP